MAPPAALKPFNLSIGGIMQDTQEDINTWERLSDVLDRVISQVIKDYEEGGSK